MIKGIYALGWGKLLEILEKNNQFRMGYKSTNIRSQKNNQRKFHNLQDIFHSLGYMEDDHGVVIEEEEDGIPNLVCCCSPDTALNNWKVIEIPKIISISK